MCVRVYVWDCVCVTVCVWVCVCARVGGCVRVHLKTGQGVVRVATLFPRAGAGSIAAPCTPVCDPACGPACASATAAACALATATKPPAFPSPRARR